MTHTPEPVPSTIGRFRVESLLGRGGMGEVYRAIDPTLQRTVAVKTVKPGIRSREYLDRLYREAQACARLSHPNIVTVFEAGEIDGVVYMAMEYLKGESLADALARGGLSFGERLRALVQILDALQHAHAEGVIHRDIKPSNVYCHADGVIKLVDFGIARVLSSETLTATGVVVGTPHYASPEQLKGEFLDARTDIYSTGALAYELVCDRRPFERDGDSVATLVLRVVTEPPPPIDGPWAEAFPELRTIVTRAMAKTVAERYQTAAEMKAALTAFIDSSREAVSLLESAAGAPSDLLTEARRLIAEGNLEAAKLLLAKTVVMTPTPIDLNPRIERAAMASEVGVAGASRRPRRFPGLAVVVLLLTVAAGGFIAWTFSDRTSSPAAPAPSTTTDGRVLPAPAQPEQPANVPPVNPPVVAEQGTTATLGSGRRAGSEPSSAANGAARSTTPPASLQEARGRRSVEPSRPTSLPASNTELSRALAARVGTLLREQAITVRTSPRVTLTMTTRPSPFAGRGITADYVATVQMGPDTRSFQGQVLGFAELTLKNEVIEKAAAEILAFVAGKSEE